MAILKLECAKPWIDSSVLYMDMATPLPLKSYTSMTVGSPDGGVKTSCSLPGPGAIKSVERYCAAVGSGRGQRRGPWGKGGFTHLVTECMAADHDGFDPPWDGLGYALDNYGFPEDGAAENVADLQS